MSNGGNLRLVIDNTDSDKDSQYRNCKELLSLLEKIEEVDLPQLFEICGSLPISDTDRYFEFVARHKTMFFNELFDSIEINEKLQQKIVLVNYFMMRVYLKYIQEKLSRNHQGDKQISTLANNEYQENTAHLELKNWIKAFVERIFSYESRNDSNLPTDPGNFGFRIRKTIESA